MSFLYPVCCICLKCNSGLKLLNTLQEKQLNYYLKISSEVADQGEEDVRKYCQICEECADSLYSVCEFIDVCQRGRVAVKTYISQLQSESTVNEGPAVEFSQTNTDPFSAAVKTEYPSEDLHSYRIHTELDLKPDPEECLTEYEQVISEDTKQGIIKTEVETDLPENDPLSAPDLVTPIQVCNDSIHEQTSSHEDVYQNNIEIPEQTNLFTDTNRKGYESTKKIQTNKPKNSYKRDTSNSSIEKPYECKICKKQFNNTPKLKKHSKIHTAEKRHECKICEKKFIKPSDLTRHSRIHTGERPYECNICTKTFIDSSRLKSHLRTHSDENLNECKICQKVFPAAYRLKEHSRSHAVEKPYECKTCNKKFNYIRNLKMHTKTHTGEKPYECKICTKTFIDSSRLKTHLRTHSGVHPYECKTCKKGFTTAYWLKEHVKLHGVEKPYECKTCNKKFNYNPNLTIHMRTHTGEKLYECKICTETFNESSKLTRHMETHTGEKTFECKVCNKKFATAYCLNVHSRSHTD